MTEQNKNTRKQKKENKIKALQIFFRHFATRLYERCGILITFEYYLELHSEPFTKISEKINTDNGRKSHLGHLKIKDKDVLVYRGDNGFKPLLTALKIKQYEQNTNL